MLRLLLQKALVQMVKQLNNKEILDKVDEIIKEIEDSDNYRKYLLLKEEINNNKELVLLINKVRQMNKDFTHKLVSGWHFKQLLLPSIHKGSNITNCEMSTIKKKNINFFIKNIFCKL